LRNPYGDADAAERIAVKCDHEADRLDSAARNWETRINRTRWKCGKADRTRSSIGQSADRIRLKSNEMRRLAQDLRRHALDIREKTRRLEDAERRSRNWIDWQRKHPPAVPMPYHPPIHAPLDIRWLTVLAEIRRHGGVV